MAKEIESKTIGRGSLSWMAGERRSDRYGTVCLWSDEGSASGLPFACSGEALPLDAPKDGARGRLVAHVEELRDSGHIGDLFRGLSPGGAVLGEAIVLGEGMLFSEEQHGAPVVGLAPDDGREDDWLDPKALYRAHSQIVTLCFEPTS